MNRVSEWLRGGDENGPAKIKVWLTGNDGRSEGYTYSVSIMVTVLMALAIPAYPLTAGYGSIVLLVIAILALVGRHLIESQTRRDMAAMREAKEQYRRTRNRDYATYVRLRGEGMLRDNRALRPESKSQIRTLVEWAAAISPAA
jgi:hypothetical protein